MPAPRLFDGRAGLPAPALADLRRATRLQLGLKDAATAVLGYWMDEAETEPFGAVVLPAHLDPPDRAAPTIIPDAQHNRFWQRIVLTSVEPGDRLIVEQSQGQLALRVGPFPNPQMPQSRLLFYIGDPRRQRHLYSDGTREWHLQ